MRRFLFLAVIFILRPICAESETWFGFADAARLAVETSLELRNEYAAKALREGAWTWGIRAYLPRFSLTASEEDRLSKTGADSFLKNYSINIDQLLWDGGRLSLSRKMEKAELNLGGSRLKQMASEIADAAVSAYREVLQARTMLEIRRKTLESLDEQRRVMRKEAELGMVLPADLIEADITVALAELDIFSLETDLEEAEWKFAEKLGLEKLPPLSERIDTERIARLPDPAKVVSFAETRNPDLAALRFSVAKKQAELRTASLSWIPSLRLTGSFGIAGRQYPLSRYNWTVGLSVEFASPMLSGNLGTSAGGDPPFDKNARMQQTLTPAPDPAAVFSARALELALANERAKYEAAVKEIRASAERGVKTCSLLDRKRVLAVKTLKMEGERYRLAELRLSLGEITRVELMEIRLDYAKREAALVEASAAVLQAERELERLLDLEPGGLTALTEDLP